MTEHLTEQQIDSFRRRKMSHGGLLAAHQHIAVCEMCRARLSTPAQVASAFAAFEREIQQEDAEDEHLSYQELSGYVDDELRAIEREIVEGHLEACAECAAEVRDLRAFKSIISAKEHEAIKRPSRSEPSLAVGNWRSRWNPVHLAGAAALVIIILAAAIFLLRTRSSHQDQSQRAPSPQVHAGATPQNSQTLPTPPAAPRTGPSSAPEMSSDTDRARLSPRPQTLSRRGEQTPSSRRESEAVSTRPARILVTLKDGGGLMTLDSGGHVSGVAASAPGLQRMLAVALRSQRLEKPPVLEHLVRSSSIQLDMSGETSPFALQQPVGTVVESTRPTFIWGPLKGASGYVVSVFDAQLNEVARSEALTKTVWKPPRALQDGAFYRWQVIASKDGLEVTLPSPTAPEAKFKVLEQPQAQALARARQQHGDSHLALGLLYARQGLLDQAETELQALVRDNPTSTVARKLLQSLRAWRPARRTPSRESGDALRPEQESHP